MNKLALGSMDSEHPAVTGAKTTIVNVEREHNQGTR
jgi:hypothetical protein